MITKNLKRLSKMKLTKNKILLLLLSIAGFFDSSYLTILHYKNIIPPCSMAKGCETVLNSQFSTILSIPIALIGSLYFLSLIFINILGSYHYLKILSFLGVLISIILFLIQAVILRAFCQYCILSEVIILIIFILSYRFRSSST